MIRFNNSKISKNKRLLIYISDFIRKIFGGNRINRLSKIIIIISEKIYLKKKVHHYFRFWMWINGGFKKIIKSV